MTSLHTKLKELRELRERAVEGKWTYVPESDSDDWQIHNEEFTYVKQDDSGVPISPDDANFIICAANNWLTLISALEKAIERLEDIGTTKIAFGPERVSSCSADEAKEALAEIAEMLK